jgi:hypothetical protein
LDFLSIYDGEDSSAPLLGTFSGNNNPGVLIASNPAGALTVVFTSDGAVTLSGWEATISCVPCVVNIPDPNFKAYLVNNPSINTNGNSVIECDEATNYSGDISVAFNGISDLTGIEAFTNIVYLDCGFNNLTSLDLSNNAGLQFLYCYYNQLTSLTLTSLTNLIDLRTQFNQLTSLNLATNTGLQIVECSNNQLTTFSVNNNVLKITLTIKKDFAKLVIY